MASGLAWVTALGSAWVTASGWKSGMALDFWWVQVSGCA